MIFLELLLQESECEKLLVVRAGNRLDAIGMCKK